MSDDLISRQAAIDAIVQCTNCGDEDTLRAYVSEHNLDDGWTGGILEALDAVKDLPPAQPERKQGEWTDGYRWQRCSLCKQTGKKSWNYCPNCGAKMTISK